MLAFLPHERTPLEEKHAWVANLYMIAIAPNGEYSREHHVLLELIPPGIYQARDGKRIRVLRTERGHDSAGHATYFVYCISARARTLKYTTRRLLIGTGHGEKAGWFQYEILPDGTQQERFTLVQLL